MQLQNVDCSYKYGYFFKNILHNFYSNKIKIDDENSFIIVLAKNYILIYKAHEVFFFSNKTQKILNS